MTLRKRNQVPKGKHGGWQLVLTEDVLHLGKQGETVEVKPGYARNYLLPLGYATIPTAHNLKQIEFFKKRIEKARLAKIEDLRGLSGQIARQDTITIEANANEEGHLYGSVSQQDISKALKGKNLKVEPDMVHLPGLIKECGLYEIELALGFEIASKIKIMVVPQKGDKK